MGGTMPARHRSIRAGSRVPRRRLTWANYNHTGLVVGLSGHGLNIDLLADFVSAGGDINGVTIMRTHLRFWPATAVAAADVLYYGLMVMGSNQIQPSFVLGASAVNNPSDDPYLDWMISDVREARPTYGVSSTNEINLDLRSKRKMEDLQETLGLSVVAKTVGASLSVDVFARTLLALP